ncbi:hypothetical protein [Streptomyces sp. NPDC006645]|uniref:hypothetical protein n=1 Tax=unclassified Streptomyces TaxID=2593676 RepID=UPI0033AB972D
MATMGAGPALRLVRTAVFAAVCVLVSGLGHALSSGGALPPRVLALAFLPMCGAGWLLSRRERGGAVIVAASAAGQLLLHAVFSALHPRPAAGHTAHGAHGHEVGELAHEGLPALLLDSSGIVSGVFSGVFSGFTSDLTSGMAGAHLMAGLVCGWWLWRGDRAFGQLLTTLGLFAFERLRFAHALLSGGWATYLPVFAPPVAYRPIRPPAQLPPPHVVSRRGPPLLPS